jgi:hypothetical protein
MGPNHRYREFMLSLEPDVLAMVKPLETMLAFRKSHRYRTQTNGLELIVGELTMAGLLISSADWVIQTGEAALVNELQSAFFIEQPFPHASKDTMEFLTRFAVLYPGVAITLDHPPLSLQLLLAYDQNHQSGFSEVARSVFSRFADAAAEASGHPNAMTDVVLGNYQAVLQAAQALREDI